MCMCACVCVCVCVLINPCAPVANATADRILILEVRSEYRLQFSDTGICS